jgi:malonyl CoA-acyl carrier protein transacylase
MNELLTAHAIAAQAAAQAADTELVLALITLIGVLTALIRQELAKRGIDVTKSNTARFSEELPRLLHENDQLRQKITVISLERDQLRDIVNYVRSNAACQDVVDEYIDRRSRERIIPGGK